MKRFILLALIASFLLGSCGNDVEVPELIKYGAINISSKKSTDDPLTKIIFDGDGALNWEKSDQQLVFLQYEDNYMLPKTYSTTESEIDGAYAVFKGSYTWQGESKHTFYSYYPAPTTNIPTSPKEVPFSISASQTQTGTSMAHLSKVMMIGDPSVVEKGKIGELESTVSLDCRILYSTLGIKFSGFQDGEVPVSLEIYSSTGNLSCKSGTVDITQYDGSRGYGVIENIEASDDNHYATLTFANAPTLTTSDEFAARLLILAGTHTGKIVITLTTNKGVREITKNGPTTFVRGVIHDTKINLSGLAPVDNSTQVYEHETVYTYQKATVSTPIPIVFMGDGYTADQFAVGGKWDSDLNESIEAFFSVEPYKTYRHYFTVYKVAAYSTDEGVTIQPDNVTKSTYFGAFYKTGVNMDCNSTKVFSTMTNLVGMTVAETCRYTAVLVVNQDRYGGTCWIWSTGKTIAICPTNKTGATVTSQKHFRSVTIHEAGGHAFGHLADEYISYKTTTLPATGTYSAANLKKWQTNSVNDYMKFYLNVASTNVATDVPWADFLTLDATYATRYKNVGIIEGAYYYGLGAYRSEKTSCMINNTHYFPAHSRWLIAKRIHDLAGESFTFAQFLVNDAKATQKSAADELKDIYIDKTAILPPPVFVQE